MATTPGVELRELLREARLLRWILILNAALLAVVVVLV